MSHKQKTILVTGATGMIGSHLIRYLLQQGYSNIRAIRRPSSCMDLIAPVQDQIQWHDADILDVPALEAAMTGVQLVYHSAALISYDGRDRQKMLDVNVEGTANIVNLCLHLGVEKLIHVSSIAAIGRTLQEQHIREKFQWQRSDLNTNYAISKFLAEQEVWRGIAEGLNAAIVNPAVVIGGCMWHQGTGKLFRHVWRENPFFPMGITGFVDTRDVARFMILLMESNISSERYIIVAENWAYQDLLAHIASIFNKKIPHIKATPIIRGIAWRMQWIISRITGKRPMITKESSGNSSRTFYYYNDKSKADFDFKYLPLTQTIADTCTAYKHSIDNGLAGKYLEI